MEASRQRALVSVGVILGALLGILVSSSVGAAFFSRMGGAVEGTFPPLGLVCVFLAEVTTTGTVNYFTLKTLTGGYLAQSTRLMDHKLNS